MPSPEQENDWGYRTADEAGLVAAAQVPKSMDLRDDSWWEIGDQKSTGSCVGWALADSVLRWHFVQASRIDKADKMSQRFIWMAAKETDESVDRPTTFIDTSGTWLKAALDVARKWGSVRESLLPFEPTTLYGGPTATFYAIAAQLKIASYFNLGRDLADWRKWIANAGPILVRLDVDSTWMKAPKGKLTTYKQPAEPAGHAVALVGYTSTGFIVRNSWGTNWGDNGYAYATNAYTKAAFTEAYGAVL
ncbi:C1 family peptidase [Kribbella sp. NPDC051952]|uniref:C1 family peptidase n=1 Tax=Kribbella sp. NPDC051952 TaxID=3154851 RepID=UPI00342C92CF